MSTRRIAFLESWFWDQVDVGDCWEWTGKRHSQGYGLCRRGLPSIYAHRTSWILLVGPIPGGYQIDHLCRNRLCINPDHLEPVTPRTNQIRGYGLAGAARKKVCLNGHPFSEENTYRPPGHGRRQCKKCQYERNLRTVARRVGRVA